MIQVNSRVEIENFELHFRMSKASGSGGQKVNKTNSRVELEWDISLNSSLRSDEKKRILSKAGSRKTSEGKILFSSELTRSQSKNKEDCISKLTEFVRSALIVSKKRIPTRISKSVKKRRQASKTLQSDKKKNRKKVDY